MSSSFVNYQIHSGNFDDIVRLAERLVETKMYISQPKNGWISVYDEASEIIDSERTRTLAQELSSVILNIVIVFIVYKSDYLVYLLYNNGHLVDEYNSDPDNFYFGFEQINSQLKEQVKGNPEALLTYCLPETELESVINLFVQREAFVEYMIYELAALLGIDEVRATSGFSDVEDGYVYDGDIEAGEEVREDQKFYLVQPN